MKISVCMIVKNEEKTIERILNCAKKFAYEIIVVDTGSVDSTKEKVEKFTDKIYDFKWIDDFSAARNFSFSKAKGDYVMWLDADDFITDENVDKIKILNKLDVDTYMLKYVMKNCDGKRIMSYYRERIMRNCPSCRFEGFIHEAIVPFGKIEYIDAEIEHRKEIEGDKERNLRIYEKRLADGYEFEPRSTYYYAKELYYNEYYEKSKIWLDKFINSRNGYLPDVIDAYLTEYRISLAKGSGDEEYLFSALKENAENAETLCLIGDAYRNKSENDKAIAFYKFALCVDEKKALGFKKEEYYYKYPLLWLTSLYYLRGEKEKAQFYHNICKNNYPNDEIVLFNDKFF